MKHGISALCLIMTALFLRSCMPGAAFAESPENDPDIPQDGEHIRLITDTATAAMEIEICDPASGERSSRTVQGSAYIPVDSSDYIQIICGYTSDSYNPAGGEFYLYFYDRDLNVIWDVLDHTDEATGERNRVSLEYLKALNGFQFTGVPDGSFVRLAPANGHDCRLLIWDGCKTGYPICGQSTVHNAEGQTERLPQDGTASIQVPATALYLIAKPGYTFLSMTTSNTELTAPVSYQDSRFPAQVVNLRGFGGAGRAKNLRIAAGYDYATGEYTRIMPNTDLSDAVIAVDKTLFSSVVSPDAFQTPVFDNIAACMDFTWTPTADVVDSLGPEGRNGTASYFREGVTYHGIPYRSAWSTAVYVGWHVSKQTFMNAVNDPDSIFYHNPSKGNPGPYYSLVCSSFATLVSGFDYPVTNFGMMKNPQLTVTRTDEKIIGGLMTNGVGHCFIPVDLSANADNSTVLTLAEQSGALTVVRNVYKGISKSWKGIGLHSPYPLAYVYHVSADSFSAPPYDITRSTIKNGSARPYRGDQSVYTSAMNVYINIKDPEATRLYCQKFDVVCDHGVLISASPVGPRYQMAIDPGTARVNLRSATAADGTYTGMPLESGAIYGVWASRDDEQVTAPDNTEFFEWHDLRQETVHYRIDDGVLVTDDVFWYAIAMGINETDYIRANHKNGLISIPYQPPVQAEGESEAHSDYSRFAARARITSARPVWAFFQKGIFGAYVTRMELVED